MNMYQKCYVKFFDFFRKLCSRIPLGESIYYWVISNIPIAREDITSRLDGRVFFVTSTGRTGTAMISKMLNNVDGLNVRHEPVPKEQLYHRYSLENPAYSSGYVNKFRMKEIFLRQKDYPYGEVNSAIRRFVPEIKSYMPNVPVVHIVRNGKDVVSSILNRASLTERDPVYYGFSPHDSIIAPQEWDEMNRFEKICFLWNEENKWLSQVADATVKFEDLISDYETFDSKLCQIIGVKVPKSLWFSECTVTINKNKSYLDSHKCENWTDAQKNSFKRLCHDQMNAHGYEL